MKKDSGKRKLICIITAIAVMALIISGVLYFRSISLTADEQMQETADSEIIKEKDSKTESERIISSSSIALHNMGKVYLNMPFFVKSKLFIEE